MDRPRRSLPTAAKRKKARAIAPAAPTAAPEQQHQASHTRQSDDHAPWQLRHYRHASAAAASAAAASAATVAAAAAVHAAAAAAPLKPARKFVYGQRGVARRERQLRAKAAQVKTAAEWAEAVASPAPPPPTSPNPNPCWRKHCWWQRDLCWLCSSKRAAEDRQ